MVGGSITDNESGVVVQMPPRTQWNCPKTNPPTEGQWVLALVRYRQRDFVAQVQYLRGDWMLADQIVECAVWLPVGFVAPKKRKVAS